MKSIIINGIAIDPTAPKPLLAAMSLNNTTAKASEYIIVQTKQPLDKSQRAVLAKAGPTIVESVPGDASICYFPKTVLKKVSDVPLLECADLYPKVVKIAPSLRNLAAHRGGVDAAAAMNAVPGKLDSTRKTVYVVLHRDVDAKKAAKRVAAAAHLSLPQVKVGRGKIRLVVKARR